jgi:hypothetical protein
VEYTAETAKRGALARAIKKKKKGKSTGGEKGKVWTS